MTVIHHGNQRYTGLAGDTKPTAANTAVNAIFFETDTGKTYSNNGSAWNVFLPSKDPGHTKVYKIGSTYYAEKHDGSLISSSGTLETVLQAALDVKGLITIDQDGNFDLNAAGVNLTSNTTLIMGPNTKIRLPSTSLNVIVFNVGGAASGQLTNIHIKGGIIEKATPTKDWYGIRFRTAANADNIYYCSVQDTRIIKPFAGMYFESSSDGSFTGGSFRNIFVDKPLNGYYFAGTGSLGLARSVFQECAAQNDTTLDDMVYGFRDVHWKDLDFIGCRVWDLQNTATQKAMTIASNASDIRIKGGAIRSYPLYYADNSTVRGNYYEGDEWNAPSFGGIPLVDSIFVRNGRRTGRIETTSSITGYGLLGGGLSVPAGETSAALTPTFADGTAGRRKTTGTTTGNAAGYRYTILFTVRGWNPVYKAKIRLNTTSLTRAFFGYTSSTSSPPASDDPLNALSGVIFMLRSADTNWQIACNDGTGVTTFTDTGIAKSTNIIPLELVAQDLSTNKWKWSINNSAWTELTDTNIPAQGTGLTIWGEIQTNESGVAKNFDMFSVYVGSN